MRYDTSNRQTVFLSQRPMGLQLSEEAVAKAVKCAKNTVQYWLNRWKKSKDLSDMKRPERSRATTERVDQRIYKLASNDNIAATGDIQNVLKCKTSELAKRQFDENWEKLAPSSVSQYQNSFWQKIIDMIGYGGLKLHVI